MGFGMENINEKIYRYYLFQKKLEYFINFKTNPFFKSNDIKIETFYVINKKYIKHWKEIIGYNNAKNYLDQIGIEDINNYINQIKSACSNIENKVDIYDYDEKMNDKDNYMSYCSFISRIIFENEQFENLVDEKTFNLFNDGSSSSKKPYIIKGIITDKLIIFFIEEHWLCKILINIELNGNFDLIQLSVDCTEMKDNNVNKEKSKKNFEKFTKYLKSHINTIITELESEGIFYLSEIQFKFKDKYSVLIKNENLNLNNLNKGRQITNNDFNNVNTFRKIGLTNVGATCYMNATLQCLINVNSLTNYLMTFTKYNEIMSKSRSCELVSAYCEVLYYVCCDSKVTNYYEPLNFKKIISSKNPLFKGINPNDSKDLINFLLEEMNHELSLLSPSKQNNFHKKKNRINQTDRILTYNNYKNDFIENNNSIIAKVFFFTIETQTVCQSCNTLKYNYQALYLLEFQLEMVFNFCLSNNMNQINNNGQKYVTLLQCFEQYRFPTFFTGENRLYCNICKSQQNSKYLNNIYSLPPTLIIILNRGRGNSFDCYVDFPAELNLQQYVICPQSITNYQLRGVISHLGESGMNGHFIAFCKHRIDNNWYCYNDSIVTFCDDQRNGFRKGTPYILFYDSINGNQNVLYDNNNLQGNDNFNFKNNMINNNNFINNYMNNFQNNKSMINLKKKMFMNNMFNMNNMNNINNINNTNNTNNTNYMNSMNNSIMNKMGNNNMINSMNNVNNMNNINNNNMNSMNNINMNNMNNFNMNSINNCNMNSMNNNNMNNMNNFNMNNFNMNNMNNSYNMNSMNIFKMNSMINMNNSNMNNKNNFKMNSMNNMNNSMNNSNMNNMDINIMNNYLTNINNMKKINNNNYMTNNSMNNNNLKFMNSKTEHSNTILINNMIMMNNISNDIPNIMNSNNMNKNTNISNNIMRNKNNNINYFMNGSFNNNFNSNNMNNINMNLK